MKVSFFKGKKVFITGHTGFKGSWMTVLLNSFGAHVTGYALEPPEEPSLFRLLDLQSEMESVIGDIRDLSKLSTALEAAAPDIVIHMAAQPLVRESYKNPVYTYDTNVMGTVNILEAVRRNGNVKSFLNVTTDKVYRNNEWEWGYRETDRLGGYDPYSNSKSCSELVTESYNNSFLKDTSCAVSTARAGNVIGGGDFATDRIIPDCARAALAGEDIQVRNPYSVRPYQHVLEPVCAYLKLAEMQYEDGAVYSGNYNFGPEESDCISTGKLTDLFCHGWDGANWKNVSEGGPHEARLLKLDCSRAKAVLGWHPIWNIEKAVNMTAEWYKTYGLGGKIKELTLKQCGAYLKDAGLL